MHETLNDKPLDETRVKKAELIVVTDDKPIKTKKWVTPVKHEPQKSIDDVPISAPKTFEELLEE